VLRFTKSVTSRGEFALPSGYLADEYQFELEVPAGRAIQSAAFAESVDELKQL
jgi:hypothetical protein